MSHPHSQQRTADVAVFYPGRSLTEQLDAWSQTHGEHRIEWSWAKSLPGIRRALRRADVVLLDATDDPKQAAETFSEALSRLDAHSVAVYTEHMHEWLELFVRVRGALLLLGPMHSEQWDGFFEGVLRSIETRRRGSAASPPEKQPARAGEPGLREPASGTRVSAAVRPRTGVN